MTWELGLPKNEPTTVKAPANKSLKLKPPKYKIKVPETNSTGCLNWSTLSDNKSKSAAESEEQISWEPMVFFGAITFFSAWCGAYLFSTLLAVTFLGSCMNVFVQIIKRLTCRYPRSKVVREIAKYPAWLMGISFALFFLVLGFIWR